ncbi:MAG TPA: efflux RND transporter periplasmic adaptor subunit [Steroidobacteraceae bacterium]|nr:efflux RND transporter periplasmic adaptor subunit [Steroidobacteraceae bacterium]
MRDPPDHSPPAETGVRPSDYAADLAADERRVESHSVSVHYAPDTARGLRRSAIILAGVLAALFVVVRTIGFLHERSLEQAAQAGAAAPHEVDVVAAAPVGRAQHFTLPGETAAWHTSTIYARVNGYVGRWFVDFGDHVGEGQVLATIETPELDAQLAAARAQLQASQAQILVRRAEAAFGKSTYERWRDSPPGVVSDQEREEKLAAYSTSEAQLKAAIAQAALDQARVNQYQALAAFKQVRAPYTGVITQRFIDIGNLVTAGSTSATTPLYVMTQNDPMRVWVDVPQSAAADLMRQDVPVTVSGTGGAQGLTWSGAVARNSMALSTQARTLKVEADIPNAAGHWVPGMYVNVSFDLPPRGLVQVPAATLLFRAGGTQVATIDADNRVVLRDVVIARDDGSMVELGSGVKVGDRLILNLSSQITAGDPVVVSSSGKKGS